MTSKEKRMCWKHAKAHVMDAIVEAIAEEHHMVSVKVGDVERGDIRDEIMRQMTRIESKVRRMKANDVSPE